MKKTTKLFVLVLISFLFVNKVYASLTCDFYIDKKEISTAEFEVKMPICKRTVQDGFMDVSVGDRKSTYTEAYDYGLDYTDVYYDVEDEYGKDIYEVHGRVPICNDTNRRVVAYSTCTVSKNISTGHESCKDKYTKDTCPNNSYCHVSGEECTGSIPYSYCSGTGYTISDGKCVKTYNYQQVVTSQVSNIESICTSANGAGTSCDCSDVEYALECPAYKCEKENVKISACTPDFELDGESVYCVNPGQHFNIGYDVDPTFSVRNCSNSYVTADCGYGNILIEGAFFETGDDAINLALRLWSYHTNQLGFEDTNRTGIANRMGDSCDIPVYFMKEGSDRPNVYANTYNYIMTTHKNDYFEKAQNIINSNGFLPSYISDPKTNPTKAKFNGTTFEEIACNGTVGVTCGKGTYTVAFELFFNTLLGNKYMMDHLDQLYKEEGKEIQTTGASLLEDEEGVWVVVEFETEDFEKVFGDLEEIPCDENDPRYKSHPEIEPYCKVSFEYYDQDDNLITDPTGIAYCRKSSGCHRLTSVKAICATETGGQRISKVEVKETKQKSGASIRKLIPCGTTEESQYMFQYVPWEKQGTHDERTSETKTYYMNYLCGDGCDNYAARISNESTCSSEFDKPYTTTVSDPSLSCIVNMANPDQKNYYDYSSKLGVNTNFCRVYCSDKVEYTVAGRTSAESGRAFKYDVRTEATNVKLRDYALTSVVKHRRTCVSEVFYDNLNKNVNWKNIYGLTDQENNQLMANATFTTLFNIMARKAETERNRKENLNQLVYDLYNCNLYNLDMSDAALKARYGIYKPGNYKSAPAWTVIKQLFGESNNYGVGPNNKSTDVVSFEGGASIAEYVNSNDGSIIGKIGQGANKVDTTAKTIVGGNNALIKVNNAYVNFCKSRQGHVCLKYNNSNEDYKYAEFGSTSARVTSHNYTFPANNYAMFVAEAETGFYNDNIYQTFENTGNVTVNTSYSDLITLDKYTYPMSLYASNECANNECKVTQTINVAPYFRAKSSDPLQTAIKDKTFTCSVKVSDPFCDVNVEECFTDLYRNVDPANMFPNGLSENSNWATPEGTKLKERIESTADLLTTSDELVDYRITLNPQQIKAIKEYNKTAGDYTKEQIFCTEQQISTDRTNYEDCTSKFLNLLRENANEYGDGTGLGTIDKEYNGISKYSKAHGE